jgi:hypothetical protein
MEAQVPVIPQLKEPLNTAPWSGAPSSLCSGGLGCHGWHPEASRDGFTASSTKRLLGAPGYGGGVSPYIPLAMDGK